MWRFGLSIVLMVCFVAAWIVLVLWGARQNADAPARWRRWLGWAPCAYTIAGTATILLGFLGQLTRDVNLPLRCCFYIPLPLFGVAALLHDALLWGRAYPRLRCGFGLLGVVSLAAGLSLEWQWEGVEPSEPQGGDVRVMQWNVHWGGHPFGQANWEILRDDIAERDPDILVLNEAPFERKHWLEDFAATEGWSLARAARTDDPYEYQLTVCSRWPLECEADEPVYNGHVLLVRIDRPGRPLRLMVVDAASNVVRQAREPMMLEVERLLTAAHAGGQTVDVVAGDFNTPGRSIAFDEMPGTAGGYALAGRCCPGWRGTWPARMPLWDIDHVWVHRTWAVVGCEHFSSWKTDHRGQLVTIRPIP